MIQPTRATRRQLVERLNSEGIPITKHALDKWCLQPDGPKPVAYWGTKALYDPDKTLELAEARLRPVPAPEVA
jgi:hypothetical protein